MAAADNLLGYWLHTEATGATRADGSGNGLDALDTGTLDYDLSATSKMGDGSISNPLTASQRCLTIANASLPADWPGKSGGTNISGDFTVYMLLRTRSSASSLARLPIKSANSFNGWYYAQNPGNDDRDISLNLMDSSLTLHTISVTFPDHTNFHSLSMRFQGSTDDEMSAWLDGVKDGTTKTPADHVAVTEQLAIGNFSDTGSRSFEHLIDEWAIWSRALTDVELATLDTLGIVGFLLAQTVAVDGLTATVTPGDVTISRGLGNVDKRGLILAAVEDALDEISNSNGYNFTYQKHHRRSMEWDQVPGSMPAILWFPGETQYESLSGVGGGRMARMRITILGYYKRQDPDSDDFSSRVLKDIERALLRAQNNPGDTHYLANAGVEWLDWIGTEVDPYYQGEFRMGRVMLDVILNYTEKGSEIVAAS